MGIRIAVLLILLSASSAFACGTCHQPHYADKGTCTACHRGSAESSRPGIAHNGLITAPYAGFLFDRAAIDAGRALVEAASCRRCHVIGGEGEQAALSLDVSAAAKTGGYLADKIRHVNDYMPDFAFSDESIRLITVYLLNAASAEVHTGREPYITYIRPAGEGVFEKQCGTCHKLLTRKRGGQGTGNTAPNLSGLFTPYFRSQVLSEETPRWTDELLLKWTANPRSIKKGAVMPPVHLTDEEKTRLPEDMH